jgi:hypothetical protein
VRKYLNKRAAQVNITQPRERNTFLKGGYIQMEIRFNLEKEARRALVKAVGEITGGDAVYQGAPSFKYMVGIYTIDRYGTLSCDGRPEVLPLLLNALAERGYVYDGTEDVSEEPIERDSECGAGVYEATNESSGSDGGFARETAQRESAVPPDVGFEGRLSVNMPLSGMADTSIDNLTKLIAAKAWIIRRMTGAETLPIERDENYLYFPWFAPESTAAEIDANTRLVTRLCETAKQKKRVLTTERGLQDGDNEKFKARCFLLSLGFIGAEYAPARKILLTPFSGSGSFKSGDGKRTADDDSDGNDAETNRTREGVSGADGAASYASQEGITLNHLEAQITQ